MQHASNTSAPISTEPEKREKRPLRKASSSAVLTESALMTQKTHRVQDMVQTDIARTQTTNSHSPDGHSGTIHPKLIHGQHPMRAQSGEHLLDDSPAPMQHSSHCDVVERSRLPHAGEMQRTRSRGMSPTQNRGGSPSHNNGSREGTRGGSPPRGNGALPPRAGSPQRPRERKSSPRRRRELSPARVQMYMEQARMMQADQEAAEQAARQDARSSSKGSATLRRTRESVHSGVPASIREGETLQQVIPRRPFCASAPLEEHDTLDIAGDSGMELLAPSGAASDFASRPPAGAAMHTRTETKIARQEYVAAPPQGASLDDRRSFIDRQLDALGEGAIVLERFVLLDSGERCHGGVLLEHAH